MTTEPASTKRTKAHPVPSQRMTRSRAKAAATLVREKSPPNLHNLPLETLQTICEYVAGSRPSDLHALSQVSRRCLVASSVMLFRELSFGVVSREKLRRDTDRFRAILDSRSSWKYVRRVCIEGRMPLREDDDAKLEESPDTVKFRKERRAECAELGEFTPPPPYRGRAPSDNPQDAYDNDPAWQPLAELLASMPALADMAYDCEEQFPPSLLQMLHRYQPCCRLHLETFRLHSLTRPKLDPHERDLATSPCLYAVSLECHGFVYGELDPYMIPEEETNLEVSALLRLIVGAAPNLFKVRLSHYRRGLPPAWAQASAISGRKLPALHPSEPPTPGRIAYLTTLVLSKGIRTLTQDDLAVWNKLTNLGALRVLKFEAGIKTDALAWAATNCSFGSLETLVLQLDDSNLRQCTIRECPHLGGFLRNLPPLKNLKISGIISPSSFRVCIQRHGSELRRLQIGVATTLSERAFDSDAIDILREHPPPLLEDLALCIKRSKGDKKEVAIYKALGALPKLQILDLTLDCADFTVCPGRDTADNELREDQDPGDYAMTHESFDEFDQQVFQTHPMFRWRQPRYGHLREAFINSALDAKLAQAIYRKICAAKGLRALPLIQLSLRSEGGCEFGGTRTPGKSRVICKNIGRSWLLQRSDPVKGSYQLATKEIDDAYKPPHAPKLDSQTEAIFRKLWPARAESEGDWRKDWCSFPLVEPTLNA